MITNDNNRNDGVIGDTKNINNDHLINPSDIANSF